MHDRNGNPLSIGDTVNIECIIKSATLDENYCNLSIEPIHNMPPYEFPNITISCNAKQVTKVFTEEISPNAEGHSSDPI